MGISEFIREIAEGEEARERRRINLQKNTFLGTSIIISHRLGVSDKLIYTNLIQKMLNYSMASFIFPLSQPSEFPLTYSVSDIDTKQINFLEQIQIGEVYRIRARTQKTALAFLTQSLETYLPRKSKLIPYIFVFDTLQKWDSDLESIIRYLIREAPIANFGVWIHCPLGQVPLDLFPSIGNVTAVWPSRDEIEFLQKHLPIDTYQLENNEFQRGTYTFSHQIINKKGWVYDNYDDNLRKIEVKK